ncbi:MAG: FAD-binding oxidoreductase [Opitutaceae bacterium]
MNDLHSRLNATRVTRVLQPSGVDTLRATVRGARRAGARLSICGGRHAMGGQQFGTDTWLIDLRQHAAIREFDQERGLLTVDAGMQWPALIEGYLERSPPGQPSWGIRQKQTGADRLTIGGALSANVHGRGLRMPPMVNDVEAFTLIDATGEVRRCSRTENRDLFSLAIGGYGLFGLISDVTLRLMPRVKVERHVEVITLDELVRVPEERDTRDWLFGNFQFSIDEGSPDFLRLGVFSSYRQVPDDAPMPAVQKHLREEDWARLLWLAHTDRARVFKEYASYYLSTHGQRYWSDTHQLSTYLDNYHDALDQRLGATHPASEMITEIYVPRPSLVSFMASAADLLRLHGMPVIYGTIRWIERDDETLLAWAREPWACIIFNLHTEHSASGLALAQQVFRALIDLAISFGGSYYLTYHRWATRAQVESCHPRFREFLACKVAHDPGEVFTSDWYRHHRRLFDVS